MKSFGSELAKQRDRFGTHHRIETVKRLVENQHGWLVRNRLCEAYTLPHSFAVCRDFSIPGFQETDAFERNLAQLVCSLTIVAMDEEKRVDKLSSGHSSRERVKLRTVTNFAEQLFR